MPAKLGFYEFLDISIHRCLNVAGFASGAMIFHHLIGLENIGSNLTSESDLPFLPVNALHFRTLLVVFNLEQLGLENLQGEIAILVLASLDRATNHDTGMEVTHEDAGFDLVHVLPPFAAGTHRRDLEILLVDLKLRLLRQFRRRINARK